ncbi:unnamed protein product [Ostreobium quekettii]|uniref:RRM domain-containing protein n=1 Tax=Ostreobium quekettii TaxID=121088 RepID=A0A8S1IUB0_9CHLO|nr:unnamed protein product [Ostreobium quekettii]
MAGADGPDGEQVIEEAGQGSGDDAMDDLEADGEREEVNGEAGAEEEAAESGGQGERQGEQQEGEGMQVEGVGEADSKKVEDVKQDTKDTTKGEDGTGPPETDDFLSMPPHGTEVFVGGLAKSTTDAEIQEFCEQCGEVFSLRVPKDPGIPGQNRGYAFVTFKTTEQAATATEKLNQKELDAHPGKKVRVILSQVKNRLFIGNVPKDLKYEDLKKVLDGEVKGATQIELLMDREGNFNRGFAFVEFYNHAAADLARKILSRPDFRCWGCHGGAKSTIVHVMDRATSLFCPASVFWSHVIACA